MQFKTHGKNVSGRNMGAAKYMRDENDVHRKFYAAKLQVAKFH